MVAVFLLAFTTSASPCSIVGRDCTAAGIDARYDSAALSYQGLSMPAMNITGGQPPDWNGSLINSVAAGLISPDTRQGSDLRYYLDPVTLCVSVSCTGCVRMYPVVPGPERSLFLSILTPSGDDSTRPATFPGTMFAAGVCLICISSLKRRADNAALRSSKPCLLKDQRSVLEVSP